MKELERIREMADKRVKNHRERKKSASLRNVGSTSKVTAEKDDKREKLIEWARSASPEQVAEVLSYVQRFESSADDSNPDEPVAPSVS